MNSNSRRDPMTLLLKVGEICHTELSRGVEATLDRKLRRVNTEEKPALRAELPRDDEMDAHKKPLRPVDTEEKPDLPAEHDFAARMNHLRPGPPETRESTIGLPQTPLDRDVHAGLKRRLMKLVQGSLVVGEEASQRDWNKAMLALRRQDGTLLWQIDAVDGSGPQDTAGFGYSTNVILYDTSEDPAVPILSVVVKENGLMLGWYEGYNPIVAYLNVRHGMKHEYRVVTLTEPLAEVPLVNEERERWVAVVGAQPKHRELVAPLLDPTSTWTVSTFGGAPAMPGLVVDKLAALVIPSPQTRHDAAPLLALAKIGAGGGLHFQCIRTGAMLTPEDVHGFFRGVVRPPASKGDNPAYTPIPPMVVARDPKICDELRSTLADHMFARHDQTGSSGSSASPLRLVQPPRESSSS